MVSSSMCAVGRRVSPSATKLHEHTLELVENDCALGVVAVLEAALDHAGTVVLECNLPQAMSSVTTISMLPYICRLALDQLHNLVDQWLAGRLGQRLDARLLPQLLDASHKLIRLAAAALALLAQLLCAV